MKKPKVQNQSPQIEKGLSKSQIKENRNELKQLLLIQVEEKNQDKFSDKNLDRENEKFQLLGGGETSIRQLKEERKKFLSAVPQNYEPKFGEFFPALGKLVGWSEEELKAYHKPHIAAVTINEVIYDRFPREVRLHIDIKNPYVRWCTRQHKNYMFLGQDGILLLEEFIDDAVTMMRGSASYDEFRFKHAAKFGTEHQLNLFKKYELGN